MSTTVAFALIAITVLAIVAVGAAGWWMVDLTLSEEGEEEDTEPPSGGRAA